MDIPTYSILMLERQTITATLEANEVSPLVGTEIMLTSRFTDVNGAYVDPATVTCLIRDPSGIINTYNYPATINKLSIGIYEIKIVVTLKGRWRYEWQTTGSGQTVGEGVFDGLLVDLTKDWPLFL